MTKNLNWVFSMTLSEYSGCFLKEKMNNGVDGERDEEAEFYQIKGRHCYYGWYICTEREADHGSDSLVYLKNINNKKKVN